jgi:hypothetical protein
MKWTDFMATIRSSTAHTAAATRAPIMTASLSLSLCVRSSVRPESR